MYTDAQIIEKLKAIPSRIVLDDDISQTLGEIEETLKARVQAATAELDVDAEKLFKLALSDATFNREGQEPLDEATALRYIKGGYSDSLTRLLQARETSRVANAMERIAGHLEHLATAVDSKGRLAVTTGGDDYLVVHTSSD